MKGFITLIGPRQGDRPPPPLAGGEPRERGRTSGQVWVKHKGFRRFHGFMECLGQGQGKTKGHLVGRNQPEHTGAPGALGGSLQGC